MAASIRFLKCKNLIRKIYCTVLNLILPARPIRQCFQYYGLVKLINHDNLVQYCYIIIVVVVVVAVQNILVLMLLLLC